MFRVHQQESRFEDGYHEELPFFRQAVALIDQCSKLMKQDRISLRNRLKEYLRDLRENRLRNDEWENEQVQQLIQIFMETNKKRSLNKIQKGDKVMDWLQIKLRKFIDGSKKEKHRREVQLFRKSKMPENSARKAQDIKNTIQYSRKVFAPVNLKANEQFMMNKRQPLNYSLSISREKSPNSSRRNEPKKQNYSNSQYSFQKHYNYMKSKPVEQKSTIKAPNTHKNHHANQIRHNQAKGSKDVEKPRPLTAQKKIEHELLFEKYAKPESSPQNFENSLSKNEINKLTQLFTQQLSSDTKPSEYHLQKEVNDKLIASNRDYIGSNLRLSGYEQSTKKIQKMFQNSKNITQSYEAQVVRPQLIPFKYELPMPISIDSKDGIFTPPDFLAQCRRFLNSSSKKANHDNHENDGNLEQSNKKLTFANILEQSRQKSIEKHSKLTQFIPNEAISENASANISSQKPICEVLFQFKNISINTPQELLLQLFAQSHRVSLDRFQIGEIMSKCNPEIQNLLQKYCDTLKKQSSFEFGRLNFDFIAVLKFFYTFGKILNQEQKHFSSFLCDILDIKKKGNVNREDIERFLQSLQSSEIDRNVIEGIEDSLQKVYATSCLIEGGGNSMSRWSLYFLELKHNHSFQSLQQALNTFEFQVEEQI